MLVVSVTAHLKIEAVLLRSAVVAASAAFFLSRSKLKRPWQSWRSLCRLPPSLPPSFRPRGLSPLPQSEHIAERAADDDDDLPGPEAERKDRASEGGREAA